MDKIIIGGIIDENPFDYRTWSGTSKFFFNALQQSDTLSFAISAQASQIARTASKIRTFHPNMEAWKFRHHLDNKLFSNMTKVAKDKISKSSGQFNTLLQIGAWYDLSTKDKLNISYHDGNLATRLSSPFGYPSAGNSFIRNALNYEKELYKKLDIIFPMSKWLASSFINDFGVSHNKVYPIGAGINLDSIADTTGRSYDSKTLLMVGKAFERKGGRFLLEAFQTVRKSMPDARLRIIGPTIKNLPDGVECVGYIQKNTPSGLHQLLQEYLNASVFVLPSLYEPFGISFVEAMAHRLPCIGTDICAMPEIIKHGTSGFLVPPENSELLAQRILELLNNPSQCYEMGEAGYNTYLKDFNWPEVTKKLVEISSEKLSSAY